MQTATPRQFPPLESVTRPTVETAAAAYSAYDIVSSAIVNVQTLANSESKTCERPMAGAQLIGAVIGDKAVSAWASTVVETVAKEVSIGSKIAPAKTIVEEVGVLKKADALTGEKAKSYEKIKDTLSQGKPGGNQHALSGDLSGKSAIDLGGSGKGRSAERVVYSTKENEVVIHDIVGYRK